jgi:uncharacterized protein (TIGR04222 family)
MELFSSWTGSDFLLFYAGLLGFACVAGWWIPARLRAPGRHGAVDDPESVAVLVGGCERLADSVLADLCTRGALIAQGKGGLAVANRDLFGSPAAKALLALDPPLTRQAARKALAIHAERIAARLQRAGLLLRPEEHTRLRWLSITPFAALLLLGLYRQRAGDAVGEPTGFLVVLLAATVFCAIIRFARSDPRTQAGIAAVRELQNRSIGAARAPRPDEAAMAVALFGTAVLVGTPWEPVHAMRQQGSGDGSSSDTGSDSGSDGGSGCGGGGCGGCGG